MEKGETLCGDARKRKKEIVREAPCKSVWVYQYYLFIVTDLLPLIIQVKVARFSLAIGSLWGGDLPL